MKGTGQGIREFIRICKCIPCGILWKDKGGHMGRTDRVLNKYFHDKRRFADLFNGALFGGEQVIKAEELEDKSETYTDDSSEEKSETNMQRSRDIAMRMRNGETLKLLAVENQNQVDYAMPFRCMQYDVMEYHQQLKELRKHNIEKGEFENNAEWLCKIRKTDRIAPVYTLCVYYGEDSWDGPRCLKDMMDFGNDDDDMSGLFADYPMRLLCVNEKEDYSVFKTEVRHLFSAMRYRRDKKGLLQLINNNPDYRHVDMDTMEAMSVMLDIPQIWENRDKYIDNEESEEGNMCQAIRELMEDARNDGIEKGIEKGRQQGIEQGRLRMLIELVKQEIVSVKDAVNQSGMSEEEFKKLL